MLWSWESEAPGAAGCGLSDDEGRARRAAVRWMREHGASAAALEEVQLVLADALNPLYRPVGACRAFEAYRSAGGIRWRQRPAVPA